jgi:hypothetical protein
MMDVANTMRKIKKFEFSFEIGGFRINTYKIYSQDQFVIIQNMDVPGLITDSNRVEISDLEWQRFWNKIDRLGVWDWEKEYFDQDVMDGVQWELMIDKKGRQRRRIFGSNKFPKNFEALTNLINDISKMNDEILGFSDE